jgi:hypothetical protein
MGIFLTIIYEDFWGWNYSQFYSLNAFNGSIAIQILMVSLVLIINFSLNLYVLTAVVVLPPFLSDTLARIFREMNERLLHEQAVVSQTSFVLSTKIC